MDAGNGSAIMWVGKYMYPAKLTIRDTGMGLGGGGRVCSESGFM